MVIRQGSKTDFAGAWLVRTVLVALVGYMASQQHEQTVAAHETANASRSSNEAVIKIKADLDIKLPRIEQDMKEMKEKSASYINIDQLNSAEKRVREDFTKQLNDQLKKKRLITNPGNHDYDN